MGRKVPKGWTQNTYKIVSKELQVWCSVIWCAGAQDTAAYTSREDIEVASLSRTLVSVCKTTSRLMPLDISLRIRHWENLKS